MEKIAITKNTSPKEKPPTDGLPFGTYFSDHMFLMNYEDGKGWIEPRIVPYGTIELEPSAMVFHYAQEVFEGLKAYRGEDGKIRFFRPEENIRRMNISSARLCIPEIKEEDFLAALHMLVEVDADWVPAAPDTSLYIRPFVIATDPKVGVHASHTYLFAIITCPVGSYYAEGLNPVKILIEEEDVRAVRGGTGFAKAGSNYAASLRAGERASAEGFSQVMWLDGVERRYIEEVGSMNVMFKISGKIVTPELGGSILSGITRKSSIEILKGWGYEIEERKISIDELIDAAKSGALEEAFGTGTAAVISPVGQVTYLGENYEVGGFKIGPVTQKLYDTLTGIQWGNAEDPYGWSVELKTQLA
jgi:branched-chain amino acid aminotransferase, group II